MTERPKKIVVTFKRKGMSSCSTAVEIRFDFRDQMLEITPPSPVLRGDFITLESLIKDIENVEEAG